MSLLSDCRVLVIDDSTVVRTAVVHALRDQGAVTYEAAEGEAARRLLEGDVRIDVILVDVEMPGDNGFELAPKLRQHDAAIVFLTGRSWGDDVARAFELGAIDYLRKPFDPVELVARVRAAKRLKVAERELRRLALVDPLTGISNRRHIEDRLDALVARSACEGHDLAVLLLDLDGFKLHNDRHGHHAGDAMLRDVADRVSARLRRGDEFGRWGGDEFLVLLPDTDAGRAADAAEEISALLDGEPVGVSVGCASWWPGATAEELVRGADAHMYETKRQRADGGIPVAVRP